MQTIRKITLKIYASDTRAKRIGTFLVVYLPSLFTMIGALLYLPPTSVLGDFGLVKTLFVLSFSLILNLITAFSLSATASNMHIGDGGSYFMISRSFGLIGRVMPKLTNVMLVGIGLLNLPCGVEEFVGNVLGMKY